MMDAKNQGLAKSIGLSNFNEQMIDRILENGLEMPAVLQVEVRMKTLFVITKETQLHR